VKLANPINFLFFPGGASPAHFNPTLKSRRHTTDGIMTMKLLLVSACALVDGDGRVLLAKRPAEKILGGLWEFPGGKMEPGELPEHTLIRELAEELAISVKAPDLAPFAFASHSYDRFHLLMPLYVCRRWEGVPKPLEHQELAWVPPPKIVEYALTPADIPLIKELCERL
jgi:8-oxo-dGTP diphosphatase